MTTYLKREIIEPYARALKFGYTIRQEEGLIFSPDTKRYGFPDKNNQALSILETVLLEEPLLVEYCGDKTIDLAVNLKLHPLYVAGLRDGTALKFTPADKL